MKLFFSVFLLSFTIALSAQNMSSAEIWDTGFDTYQRAETLLNEGNKGGALKEFKTALSLFKRIKKEGLSGWQDKIITYRINLCDTNIKALSSGLPVKANELEPSIKINTTVERKEKQQQNIQLASVEKSLKVYIDKLNQEVRKTKRLEQELTSQTKLINDAEMRNTDLQKQLNEVETTIKQLRTAHAANLKINKETTETKLAAVNDKAAKLANDKTNTETILKNKEQELSKTTKEIDRLTIQANNLKSALELKETVVSNLKNKIATLESSLAASKETAVKTQEYVTSQKLYISKLTAESEKQTLVLENEKKKIKALENKLESGSKENYEIKLVLQEKVAKLSKALSDLQALTIERDKLSGQLNENGKIVQQFQSNQTKTTSELTKLQAENKKLQETVSTKEVSISELQKNYESIQRQFVQSKASLSKANVITEGQKKLHSELQSRIKEVESRLNSSEQNLAVTKKQLGTQKDQLSKAKDTLKATLLENRTIEQRLAQLKTSQQGEHEKLTSFQKERIALTKERNELKNAVGKSTSELARERESSSNLKIQIARLNMQLKTKDVDIAVLKEQLVKVQKTPKTIERPSTKAIKPKVAVVAKPKGEFIGTLYPIKSSSSYVTHALVDAARKTLCYLHFNTDAAQFERKQVSISGKKRAVKGWSVPLVVVTAIVPVN